MMVLLLQVALRPGGKPVDTPTPVAPVVAMVTVGDIGALIQTEGLAEGGAAVLTGLTVIVPVAFTVPHPPASGME